MTGFAEIIIVLFFGFVNSRPELCAVLEILLAEGSPAVPPKEKRDASTGNEKDPAVPVLFGTGTAGSLPVSDKESG